MQRVNIEHLAERQIGELSGGQKRVFLARALAQQSKIILLDEPLQVWMLKPKMPLWNSSPITC